MEFITIEALEKILSPKDLMTFAVIWFFVKNKVSDHFKSIETSLVTIGQNIQSLKDSILDLERSQSKKISDLSDRVTKLEEKR